MKTQVVEGGLGAGLGMGLRIGMGAAIAGSWCSLVAAGPAAPVAGRGGDGSPNILFIVYDDVGIDQMTMQPYGWTADIGNEPKMPVLEAIIQGGVAFTNFWSMPECSPGRSCFITGRWPHRTGVVDAIVDPMLPQVQLNPAEFTLPQLLNGVGYTTAMIGKYHLAGDTSPAGNAAPVVIGKLDFYDGNLELPPSIDKSVGGQLDVSNGGGAPCGTPTVETPGAACFQGVPGGVAGMEGVGCFDGWPPLDALAAGGIPLLKVNRDGTYELAISCAEASCDDVTFENLNAYYAWERTIVDGDGTAVQIAPFREYMTTDITNRSVEWIKNQTSSWMCMVTYTASHTPIQTPPPALLPDDAIIDFDCSSSVGQRQVFKLMTEAMDREQGRLLVELGLGSYDERGDFKLGDLSKSNTMIVVVTDNGSYGPTVRPPFDPLNAKQTVFQTGVRVPCVVAGPMVKSPGRSDDHMVNMVDLFGLFTDVTGVDLDAVIPRYRPIDAEPMLPYLVDPDADEIRLVDFTMYAPGVAVPGSFLPCVVGTTCIDTMFPDEGLCTDNSGVWYGGQGTSCCELISAGILPTSTLLPPTIQFAVRKGLYKLAVLEYESCAPVTCSLQFYKLDESVPPTVSGVEACANRLCISNLSPEDQEIYDFLRNEMMNIILSEPYCVGDGNLDWKIDGADLGGVLASWNLGPSFYDFNEDGLTNETDLGIVLNNWTPDCSNRLPTLPPCLVDPPVGNIPGDTCLPCGGG